jgi:hypothetical protein
MFNHNYKHHTYLAEQMDNRRKVTDRRITFSGKDKSEAYTCNRRIRPDRRLNSISLEWIPIENIKLHPVTRLVFSRR